VASVASSRHAAPLQEQFDHGRQRLDRGGRDEILRLVAQRLPAAPVEVELVDQLREAVFVDAGLGEARRPFGRPVRHVRVGEVAGQEQ
jgi:hypothetical protein